MVADLLKASDSKAEITNLTQSANPVETFWMEITKADSPLNSKGLEEKLKIIKTDDEGGYVSLPCVAEPKGWQAGMKIWGVT